MKVFLDTNVLLDVLMESRPWKKDSLDILRVAQRGEIKAYLSSQSIVDASYVFSKSGRGSMDIFKKAIGRIMSIVTVVPVSAENIKSALCSSFEDFEDAAQLDCASEAGCDAIVSSDKEMAANGFPVYNPGEFCNYIFS